MAEARETRVFYKALSDFANVSKSLRNIRQEIAKTQAAEKAFNAASAKERAASTRASTGRSKSLAAETAALKGVLALQTKYRDRQASTATAVVAATKAIKAQNTALLTNDRRLRAAGEAAREYATAQRRISRATGVSSDAIRTQREVTKAQKEVASSTRDKTEALKEEAAQFERTRKASVRFVEDVGQVDEATGEVIESTEKVSESTSRWGDMLTRASGFLQRYQRDMQKTTEAQGALDRARLRQSDAVETVRISEMRLAEALKRSGAESSQVAAAQLRLDKARRTAAASADSVTDAVRRLQNEGNRLPPVFRDIEGGGNRLFRSLQRFGNWRPRLVPPFIALIPIIGAVIAAINPLVSILGTLGPLSLGVASSIGSLSGAFLALPGILSAVVGGIASVIASFGGVGAVFKAYGAMQKAMGKSSARGGGSGGASQADRAYDLARAEWNLAKAQKNVQKAQENLNKARQQALEDLIDLREEVSRASLNEERALANLAMARDAYNNVMADPASQAGDKLDAAVAIKEAEADLADVRKTNVENQKELNDLEAKGIENSERVTDAKDDLTDAMWAERDAQKSLRQEQTGGAAAADAVATATNEYADALAKLSPSARAFALAIIGMKDQWEAFQRTIQEAFFGQFVSELDRMPRILQSIEKFLKPAAESMGRFARNFLILLDSPEWASDFGTIGEQNGRVLDEMGRGGLALADALKDLVVAAGPFTEWLVGSLADGVENLRDLVDTGRETGELAGWLEKVAGRLDRWWQVIKNIGSTLFNYSAAASGFGDWILDNLVEMTAGWAESAQKAREDGSPFQKWLEDIKPLLGEINDLFGTFFSWFREESMDPANIKDATELVRILREDLGPALGGLLDALAETNIDEKFVETLASIIESLTTIMENGGGEALETFFDVVEGFFQFLADVVSKIPPDVLSAILKAVGGFAAISFIGKFTGLTNLLGALLGLGTNASAVAALKGLFGKIPGISGLSFSGVLGFLGTLLKVAGVAGAIATVVGGLIDVGGKSFDAFEAVNRGDVSGAKKNITNVDTGLAFTANPLSPLPGSPGSNPLPVIRDIAGGIDSIFGTNLKEELQTFIDESLVELSNFVEEVGTNWDNFWNGISEGWATFWENMGDPEFWNGLGEGLGQFILDIGTNWNNFWGGIEDGWNLFWGTTLPEAWNQFWGETIPTGWSNFTTWLSNEWNGFWGGLKMGWDNFWNLLSTGQLWANVQNELTNFGNTFRTGWDNFWNGLGDGFAQVVNGIGTAWAGIQQIFATPVNWVIQNVWNGAVVPFWNGVASKLGFAQLGYAGLIGAQPATPQRVASPRSGRQAFAGGGVYGDSGVTPGYTPGRDVHRFYSNTGGILDLSGGEAIMRPEFTRAVGGKKGVDALNADAIRGSMRAFAKGGTTDYLKPGNLRNSNQKSTGTNKKADVGGDVWDVVGGVAKMFSDPVGWAKEQIGKLVNPLLGGIQNNEFGRMMAAVPGKFIENIGGYVKNSLGSVGGAIGGAANALGWQKQWAIVKSQFPGASLNSAFRPGAITSTGSKSYHGQGRAIDVTPSMAIFEWIRSNFPNSRELIYSPANGRQLQNGAPKFWGEPVRSQHFDHVHWAMKQGGIFPKLYDNGGVLPHGGYAYNQSGKPEAVLTNEESRGLKALLAGSGLSTGTNVLGSSAASAFQSAPALQDYSVKIENLTINNPVPEKVSLSLPKSIRQMAYMNQARSGN